LAVGILKSRESILVAAVDIGGEGGFFYAKEIGA
jgi:hypothetical protein